MLHLSGLPNIDQSHRDLRKTLRIDQTFSQLSPYNFLNLVFASHGKINLQCDKSALQEILNEATTGTRAAPTSNLPSGVATAAATSQPTQADREWAALQANEAKL